MLTDTEIELIRHARHGDPFAVLGPHAGADGRPVSESGLFDVWVAPSATGGTPATLRLAPAKEAA